MSERSDEIAELVGGQRSTNPAKPLSQVRVIVLRAQHDLERPAAAHQAREVLGASSSGNHTERRLELTENRRLSRGEPHVAGENELAADAADTSLDLGDGDEADSAHLVKQEPDPRFAGHLRRLTEFFHARDVDVCNEVAGVGALEHESLDAVVSIGLPNERDQVADQL